MAVGDSSNIYLFRLIKILKPQTIFEKSIFGLKNQKLIARDKGHKFRQWIIEQKHI